MLLSIDCQQYYKKPKAFQGKNEPIAIVGGNFHEDPKKNDGKCDLICIDRNAVAAKCDMAAEQFIGEDFFKKGRKGRLLKRNNMQYIIDAMGRGLSPDQFDDEAQAEFEHEPEPVIDYMQDKYREAKKLMQTSCGKEIKLHECNLRPLPIKRGDQYRECLYIFGPTGSGKSYYAMTYSNLWLKMFTNPSNIIYRFSRVKEDKSFSRIDKKFIKNVTIDERMITEPITPEQLHGSLTIFDDIDTLPDTDPKDKAIKNSVLKLREDLLQTGRHESVYVINTSHLGMNWKGTRSSINEATSVTFFPSSGTTGGINKFLKTYAGLMRHQIEKIMSLPSRWVTLYMNSPRYVLYECGAYLL
jgi:hypothetical protein